MKSLTLVQIWLKHLTLTHALDKIYCIAKVFDHFRPQIICNLEIKPDNQCGIGLLP